MQFNIAATFNESMRPQDSCRYIPAVVFGLPAIERAKIRNERMRYIPLTQGKFALVDDADYEWLNKRKWYATRDHHTFYSIRKIRVAKGKYKTEIMHRIILGLQFGDCRQCDHIDGNGLNNQRSNLRICTNQQNQQSIRKWKIGSSRYKGVYWHRCQYKWVSRIKVNGKLIWLGAFNLETDAARAYDEAALQHHGEFALTNAMMSRLRQEEMF